MATETKCALPTSSDEAIQMIGPDDQLCPKTDDGDHCDCWYDLCDDGGCCFCEVA